MKMNTNWNAVNNSLSEAVLNAGVLIDLLSELGCDPKGHRGGRQFRGRCPVHHGDGQNFTVGSDGKVLAIHWACHSHLCHKNLAVKNNLLGLVRGALSEDMGRLVPMGRAVGYIQDFLRQAGPSSGRRNVPSVRPKVNGLRITRDDVRSRLVLPSPYFLARGFDPTVLNALDIGDSAKLGKAVVPIYDDAGTTCIGYGTREMSPEGAADGERWRFPKGFAKGDYLYNLSAVLRADPPFVLLVEGAPDVFRATEAGIAAVACFGTDLTDRQAIKLAALHRPVIIALDNDNAGRAGALRTAQTLRSDRVEVTVRHPPAGFKDVGEMTAAEVREWV